MEDMRTVLMDIDTLNILCVNIASNVGTLIYNQNRFSMRFSFMCKMAPYRPEPTTKKSYIIIFPSPHLLFQLVSLENISCVNFLFHIVQALVITVCNDSVAHSLNFAKSLTTTEPKNVSPSFKVGS